ncbi:MAG: peptidylprolyl isomerase [Bacteroidetes bacterium]|nr:peptidylprolyl isomerase [Bacteroidota bacterium]
MNLSALKTGLILRIAAFLILLGATLPKNQAAAQDQKILDEIVAVVGNSIILQSEVDGYVLGLIARQQMVYSDELWQSALDQLINEKVLVIHAKRDTNLVVTDLEVDQGLDSRIDAMKTQVGGQARLEDLYGKTVIEIKAELREDYRDQILAENFRRQKVNGIKATPTDVRAWFDSFPTDSLPTLPLMVRVSHLVRMPVVTQVARDEATEIITAIRDSVIAGVIDMENMAELFSDDPGSAEKGGLYEDMSLSEVVPEFAAVAARSPIGAYSRVFETQFGLHFLRVNARRGERIDYNHILVAFDERKVDSGPAISFLTQMRDSVLTGGASFAVLASQNSEEESSKATGGRVSDPKSGERNLYLEALGALWQKTLLTMEVGDISEPSEVQLIDGRRAFHIVKLEARIPEHRVDISTDYKLISQRALEFKQSDVMQKWLADLKADVYIDLRGKARDSLAKN